MPTPEKVQRILQLLQKFRGIDKLRQLLWVELNYNQIDSPIHELPEAINERINEPPSCFAAAGINNGFNIIYTQLRTDKPQKTDERRFIAHCQTRFPHALYIFSNPAQDHWHFVNVKAVSAKRKELKPKYLFRRITIASHERLRTAAERIAMLDIEMLHDSHAENLFTADDTVTPLEIAKLHDDAFDVEAVTEAFFQEYKGVFKTLQTELENQTDNPKWAHDYAQQFLSRCLFLYFIQRKRWLRDDTEFLRTCWKEYKNTAQAADTFVEKWLNILFFKAFNNLFHGGYRYFPESIRETLQLAPYLNGGLFRENELDTAYTVKISDELWQQIFTFFERYNFTIAEDTPLDQEVAVDPEMIGKVYESLVSVSDETNERGDAGIFYTPRIEIDLMCRLALVDNLTNHIGDEHKHALYEALFSLDETDKELADANLADQWEAISQHLNAITILDPACGSGSFLVGMLHILHELHMRAERHLGSTPTAPFERKKAIIGKNLYGVDVKQWACKVTELRLWLALIIDAEYTPGELNVRNEPLLPDFSFNIRDGDSIVQDIGGMNLAQTRALGSGVPRDIKRKITNLQTEKLKFYNGKEDRKYTEKYELQDAEHRLFRELLQSYDIRLSKDIRAGKAWLEDPSEQISLPGMQIAEYQLDFETLEKRDELAKHEENREQVRRVHEALSSNTTPPFVWDIAFVEIFNQRGGFDIVVENPPYIRQEQIADPTLPSAELRTANKKTYKAKLARSVYQAFPNFFEYQPEKDMKENPASAVKQKLDAKSDLYVYFYFHGLSLLNSKGTFCTITSNSWLDAYFGKNLKEFLLKQCHCKMVLDNQARRSFKGVNINTVICLISAPDKNPGSGLQKTVRFVNFTEPFEAILDPVVFYEIETATERTSTPEHRIHPVSQRTLLDNGMDEKGKYAGNKWGGKYLRASDIYWSLLEKGKDKLVRVGDIAEVRMGLKTGANRFFILDSETISAWDIEAEFLRPFIASPKNVNSLRVNPEQLPKQLFMCLKEKSVLSGTSALEYIKWGESQNFHKRPSCRNRSRWYDVGKRPLPYLFFPRRIPSSARTLYSTEGCYALDKFVEVNAPAELRVPLCFSLNSSLFQLMVNVSGRSSLGYGVLELQTSDLVDLLCVNPNLLNIDGGG